MARKPSRGMSNGVVTVFGGTGFVGRRIVKHLLAQGLEVRTVSRHPPRGEASLVLGGKAPQSIQANILDPSSIAGAIAGSIAVVNAVSLYVERGKETFERVHVQAASDLAKAARDVGVEKFIQISGLGSDARSPSAYISARGRGEEAVKAAFSSATIVRPAVMTGPDDAFLTAVVRLVRLLPVYPLFGNGETLLQPVYVEDVAEGIARIASRAPATDGANFEFAGPHVYAYRDLVREVATLLGKRIALMSVPFPLWTATATVAEWLPAAPLTRNQVELMQDDNVPSGDFPSLADLGIDPSDIDEIVRMIEHKR
ncbi:MAG: complex I NDUFA9 subunit family protein [Mesorhizobium sp.]